MEIPLDNINFQIKITTVSDTTLEWFNRALLFMYDFNHEEAINCCNVAISYDPECAMTYFLKAYCYGINYNYAPKLLPLERAKD